MNHYTPPLADIQFLFETFEYDQVVATLPNFEEFDLETTMGLLEAYSGFCVEQLLPLNAVGDQHGVKHDPSDFSVTLPDGYREAYEGFCENGYVGMPFSPEHGGVGAPISVATLGGEILIACNKSFSMCSGLSSALVDSIIAYGDDYHKETYLEKLVSGEWAGTMCLTEPQCGTDLGLLTTKAEAYGDHHKLTGTKIWITFGEHNLTDNIIHLVLARLPGAPDGIKGISTFLVPKFLADGTRNPIFCGSTDHKMGIHASPTCVMNLEGAEGWLIGEPNRGMRTMFVMMNHARLNVGIEGVALAEAAYQSALAFAKDRRQSRSLDPSKQDRNASADNILVHPDVRRMLLNVKSTTEGMRALVAWISMQLDVAHHSQDEATKQKAEDLVALFTPIIKSYGSERGFANVSEAMQVMGGAGYTQDWPVEQHLRDVRIAMIYEGTNHIQALDLVGRKLPMHGGRLLRVFADEVQQFIASSSSEPAMAEFLEPLGKESQRLTQTTMELGAKAMADPELVGAVANNYLNQFATVTLAFMWAKQVAAALPRPEDDELRRSKVQTARFFFQQVLPEAALFSKKVAAGKESMTEIDVALL
ncbi:MAG: acyl-CoA dehydrogenase C-terminal domain-containing protein [Myxococcota bacterium]